jgi:hypothetical protein
MTADDVRALLRARINGSQASWAKANGVSPAYVSDVLSGRREPGDAILKALGLVRHPVAYRKAQPA